MHNTRPDFTGIGWAFPMSTTASGGIAMVANDDCLIKAMRLILSTYPGERPMRPEFGCRLRDYVFRGASIQTAAEIAGEVHNALLRWEPRVIVESVDAYPDPDDQALIYIDIRYTTKATNDQRNLVFPFYSIPDEGSD
ncbi:MULTISPECIES: GPW/gp25 family protein [unclassified Streptomyces]|uniref:GPW/gp25 family protein n=1 Tax=Streptomyces sp. NBC_00180 TaxID=2903632 RepID=A0AAU1I9W8_9ACTN|nr:GPW/gp25 family protein [Streptomyces sp. NBC_01017]WSV34846.1 GPW/gp25 family protein [Streptomyces sp. NBC_01017]